MGKHLSTERKFGCVAIRFDDKNFFLDTINKSNGMKTSSMHWKLNFMWGSCCKTILMMRMLWRNKKRNAPAFQNTEFNWILFTLHAKFAHSIHHSHAKHFVRMASHFYTLIIVHTRWLLVSPRLLVHTYLVHCVVAAHTHLFSGGFTPILLPFQRNSWLFPCNI